MLWPGIYLYEVKSISILISFLTVVYELPRKCNDQLNAIFVLAYFNWELLYAEGDSQLHRKAEYPAACAPGLRLSCWRRDPKSPRRSRGCPTRKQDTTDPKTKSRRSTPPSCGRCSSTKQLAVTRSDPVGRSGLFDPALGGSGNWSWMKYRPLMLMKPLLIFWEETEMNLKYLLLCLWNPRTLCLMSVRNKGKISIHCHQGFLFIVRVLEILEI